MLRLLTSFLPYKIKRVLNVCMCQLDVRGYSSLSEEDKSMLINLVDGHAITDEERLKSHSTDWIRRHYVTAKLVLSPSTTDQISSVLSYCNKRNIAVVPQGGNTGLACGAIPVHADDVVLTLGRLNKILGFDSDLGVITCEAGCILENLDEFLEQHGYCMPLDLGAKGSCQIGGNVATHAGGLNVVRYGMLRGSVLGLEVILADGKILDCMSTLRKDNTGYDVKQLFIGSEGTLGVISKVAILAPIRSKYRNVAIFGCDSYHKLLKTLSLARNMLNEIIMSLEYLDNESIELVCKYMDMKNPISNFPFYILIETSGSNEVHDKEKMYTFVDQAYNSGVVSDGTIAEDSQKAAYIWSLRDKLLDAQLRAGWTYKYDFSIPLNTFHHLVNITRNRVKHLALCTVSYGHLGDSNIHLNVLSKEYNPEIKSLLEPFLFEWVASHGGSISAEHGLGYKKAKYIHLSKSAANINMMRNLKLSLDPNCILNPNKTILLDDSQLWKPQ